MLTNKLIERREFSYHVRQMMFFISVICFLIAGNIARAEYNIGISDVLDISVFGEADLKSEIRVSADGRINFPLTGGLLVAGKTTFEVEKIISYKLMHGGFVRSAQVTVNVLEYNSRRISVLGYVNKPGRYSLENATSLLDMIALAGGIKDSGGEQIVLTRDNNGQAEKQVIDLHTLLGNSASEQIFKMQPNDIVYVPKAPVFYIYGQVQRPGDYPVERNLSVVKALSIGGGLSVRGTQRGIVIKRKDRNGDIQEIDVELTDPVLEGDVIFIGERLF